MNETQARTLREAHDAYVKRISRKPRAELKNMYFNELSAEGRSLLFGGPSSKDELVSALVELRYPLAKMNESVHVLYHQEWTNSACELCHPRHSDAMTGRCDCSLGRESRQASWDFAKSAAAARLTDA